MRFGGNLGSHFCKKEKTKRSLTDIRLTTSPPFSIIVGVGEWLNGRVAVSKTVGCVFESRLPCHIKALYYKVLFPFFINFFFTDNRRLSDLR